MASLGLTVARVEKQVIVTAPGIQGPPGIQGEVGETGETGPMGPQGNSISIKGTLSAGAWSAPSYPTVGDIWIAGGDITGDVTGILGDGIEWTGTLWVNVGQLRGPIGETGPDGPQGIQGEQGVPGPLNTEIPMSQVTGLTSALAGALSGSDYLGEITALGQSIPAASGNSGKWYSSKVAGALTDSDVNTITVAIGDRIVSNGTDWQRYAAPPVVIADGSITKPLLEATVISTLDKVENGPQVKNRFTQGGTYFAIDSGNGLRLFAIDHLGQVTFIPGLDFIPDTALDSSALRKMARSTFIASTGAAEIAVGDRVVASVNANGEFDIALTQSALAVVASGAIPFLGPQVKKTFLNGRVFEVVGLDSAGNYRLALGVGTDGLQTSYGTTVPDVINGTRHLDQWWEFVAERFAGSSATYVLNCIGDSWTWIADNWIRWVSKRLKSKYGSAGPGYISFCPTSADSGSHPATHGYFADYDEGGVTRTGTNWTKSNYDGRGPDALETTSATVGEKVTLTLAVSCDTIRLHYLKKSGGGDLRWRIGSGSWTTVATANASDLYSTLDISVTGQSPSFTLDFEVETSGSTGVTLFGAEAIASTPGVRINRLGHSGSKASHFSAANAKWDSAMAVLAANGSISCFGTNDQVDAVDQATFTANCSTITSRLRAIDAAHDITFMAPWENLASRSTPISVYEVGAHNASIANQAAMISLPNAVASTPTEYRSDTNTPWMQYPGTADTLHPSSRGNKLISSTVLRALDSLN